MSNIQSKYDVTWMGESVSIFEIDLTEEEKSVIARFLNQAAKHVEAFDMPTVYFNDERCGGM